MTTVQNVNGTSAITNVQPPPEGTMAAKATFTLTPNEPSISTDYQLSSQGGLLLSQVVTISVDNSGNPYPVSVVHGALQETVQVAAFSTAIIPTFSGRGPYPITVSTLNSIALNSAISVDIIFMNYNRPTGTFSATAQSTIIATGQNTDSIASGVFGVSGNGTTQIAAAGNYILDSLDLAVESANPTAAGLAGHSYALQAGSTLIQSGLFLFTASAGGMWVAGTTLNSAGYRTWSQGLILPRATAITLVIVNFTNLGESYMRVNISGVNTP